MPFNQQAEKETSIASF